jgi:hypothetical protein
VLLIVERTNERNLRREHRKKVLRAYQRGKPLCVGCQRQIIDGGDAGILEGQISSLVKQEYIIAGINQCTGIQRYQWTVIHVGHIADIMALAAIR